MSGFFNQIKDKIKNKQGGPEQWQNQGQNTGYQPQQGQQPGMYGQQPAQYGQQPPQQYQQQGGGGSGGKGGPRVTDFGADPSGRSDSLRAFQDAVNSNTTTLVPQGTYLLDGELFLKGGKQLKGEGSNKPTLTKSKTGSIILEGSNNLLENLNIDGRNQMHSGIVILGSKNTVQNCNVSFHGAHGICLDGQKTESRDNIIKNNFLTTNKGIGIAQNKSSSNQIRGNDINSHKEHAITTANQSNGCVIRDNILNKNGQGNNGQVHIDPGCRDWDVGLPQGVNIMEYRVDAGGKQDCLRQFQDALNQRKVVLVPSGTYLINGNLIFQEGQRLQGMGTGHWKPKLIKTREGSLVFQGNNNQVDNFDIDGQNQMASGFTILGNHNNVSNCLIYNHKAHGICLDGQAPGGNSHDNTIFNNISHHNAYVGVAQNKSTNNKISFNVLYENGNEGLTVDNQSHGCIATFNTIFKNNNGVGGVGVDMVRDCQISNNQIFDTKLDLAGIKLQNNLGPTDNNQFHDNDIYNCRGYAVHLSNNENRCCNQNSVKGNRIRSCKKGNYGMIQIDNGCNGNMCDPNHYN